MLTVPHYALYVDAEGDIALRHGDRYGYVRTPRGRYLLDPNALPHAWGSTGPDGRWRPVRLLPHSRDRLARIAAGAGRLELDGTWTPSPDTDLDAWDKIPRGSVVETTKGHLWARNHQDRAIALEILGYADQARGAFARWLDVPDGPAPRTLVSGLTDAEIDRIVAAHPRDNVRDLLGVLRTADRIVAALALSPTGTDPLVSGRVSIVIPVDDENAQTTIRRVSPDDYPGNVIDGRVKWLWVPDPGTWGGGRRIRIRGAVPGRAVALEPPLDASPR